MNLLHLIHRYYPFVGGSEQVMQEISERLVRDGHAVSLYTTDAWDLEHFWRGGKRRFEETDETHNGVAIRRFPVNRLPLSPLVYPATRRLMALVGSAPFDARPLLYSLARTTPRVPTLERALDTMDAPVDLVHVANISLDSLVYAAARFSRRRRVPLVITPFTHLGEPGDGSVRRANTMPHQIEMLSRADAVIVQTELEARALAECGVPRDRMHCIGVGVNPEKLAGGDGMRFRAKYHIGGPIVAFLGAAAYDKGAMHLVRAMETVWRQCTEATLVFAGPLLSPFQQFMSRRSEATRNRTRILGFISDADKRDLLAASDLVALPSRTESFGIVYLEAWLYNKPVIGAAAGGVPAVITDRTDGLIVRFGDTDALASGIERLLGDRALAARMGRAGRERVLREWTWDHKYAEICALYERLVR